MILLSREVPTWANAPAAFNKFDRNAVELPRYADIERSMTDSAQHIVSDLQRKSITEMQAVSRFKDTLIDHETAAFVAGRRARGDLRDHLTPQEERMLEARHERNMRYFKRFASDVVEGRGTMNYHRRAGQYGKSLWALYTRGETSNFVDPEDYSGAYFWVLDPDAEHCSSENPMQLGCVQRAKMSNDQNGFSWEYLSEIGWPTEMTPCGANDRCHIRVVRHQVALPSRLDQIPPADTPEDGLKIVQQLLGGPDMPIPLPAAGVPYVKVPPAAVHNALRVSSNGAELGRMLPTLPGALVKPEAISVKGDNRVYVKDGLVAAVMRALSGIWELVLLMLLQNDQRKAFAEQSALRRYGVTALGCCA